MPGRLPKISKKEKRVYKDTREGPFGELVPKDVRMRQFMPGAHHKELGITMSETEAHAKLAKIFGKDMVSPDLVIHNSHLLPRVIKSYPEYAQAIRLFKALKTGNIKLPRDKVMLREIFDEAFKGLEEFNKYLDYEHDNLTKVLVENGFKSNDAKTIASNNQIHKAMDIFLYKANLKKLFKEFAEKKLGIELFPE